MLNKLSVVLMTAGLAYNLLADLLCPVKENPLICNHVCALKSKQDKQKAKQTKIPKHCVEGVEGGVGRREAEATQIKLLCMQCFK